MTAADKVSAILTKAEALAGHSLGDRGSALAEMAAQAACAWCDREDIPEDMEVVVAALTVSLAEGREVVKALTRGDTSITYDTSGGMMGLAALTALAPWRRLGRLKEARHIPAGSPEASSSGPRGDEQ